VTDVGLGHLRALTGLECLYLGGPFMTDAGVVHLASLKGLLILDLERTEVTEDGLAAPRRETGATVARDEQLG